MKKLLVVVLALACTAEARREPPSQVLNQATIVEVPEVVPQAIRPPEDNQVIRDAIVHVTPDLPSLGLRLRPMKVRTKNLDEYEKDSCNTVTVMKIPGGEWVVYAVYKNYGSFWKLSGISSKIYQR